jgi:hypothetical protein
VSLLDVRDLLALRLVSRKTREWVDAVLPSHPTKALTLYVAEEKTLHELVEEDIAHGIPFFRGLTVRDSTFFSHPLLPKFLRIYGSQIQTVYRSDKVGGVGPYEVAFYKALPNLTQLSTGWLGDNVPAVKMPALERLKLHTIRFEVSDRTAKINFHFLLNFPNLTHLWRCGYPTWKLLNIFKYCVLLGRTLRIRMDWRDLSQGHLLFPFARSSVFPLIN